MNDKRGRHEEFLGFVEIASLLLARVAHVLSPSQYHPAARTSKFRTSDLLLLYFRLLCHHIHFSDWDSLGSKTTASTYFRHLTNPTRIETLRFAGLSDQDSRPFIETQAPEPPEPHQVPPYNFRYRDGDAWAASGTHPVVMACT